MAQAIVVQEHALNAANARIQELEALARPAGGGFLGSIFGGAARPQPSATPLQGYQGRGSLLAADRAQIERRGWFARLIRR